MQRLTLPRPPKERKTMAVVIGINSGSSFDGVDAVAI